MVVFENGVPSGGVIKIDASEISACDPSSVTVALMGVSLDDNTDDGSNLAASDTT